MTTRYASDPRPAGRVDDTPATEPHGLGARRRRAGIGRPVPAPHGTGAGRRMVGGDEPAAGWRDTVRAGCDVAVIGFVMLMAALPVVTAGGAIGAGSAAVHHWCEHRELPPARTAARWFVRGLLPGLGALAVAALGTVLVVADLRAATSGRVPGGAVLVGVTLVVVAAAAGAAALVVVHVGRQGGAGWLAAVRAVLALPRRSLPAVPALAGVLAVAGLLAVAMPATVPLTAAAGLFALHAVSRRFALTG